MSTRRSVAQTAHYYLRRLLAELSFTAGSIASQGAEELNFRIKCFPKSSAPKLNVVSLNHVLTSVTDDFQLVRPAPKIYVEVSEIRF